MEKAGAVVGEEAMEEVGEGEEVMEEGEAVDREEQEEGLVVRAEGKEREVAVMGDSVGMVAWVGKEAQEVVTGGLGGKEVVVVMREEGVERAVEAVVGEEAVVMELVVE